MAELEVRGEGECLGHGDVSPRLEHHHRDGATREGVTDDQLGDDAGNGASAYTDVQEGECDLLQAYLLVGDGLNHTDRDGIHERYGRHRYASLGK